MPPTTESVSLGDALPLEIERCRELVKQYEFIGPAGNFGKVFILADIRRAEKAMMSGDVVEMLRAYQKLKGCK